MQVLDLLVYGLLLSVLVIFISIFYFYGIRDTISKKTEYIASRMLIFLAVAGITWALSYYLFYFDMFPVVAWGLIPMGLIVIIVGWFQTEYVAKAYDTIS